MVSTLAARACWKARGGSGHRALATVYQAGAGLPLALALLPLALLVLQWTLRVVSGDGGLVAQALPSARGWRLLGNSVALAASTACLAGTLGAALALWLYATDHRLAQVVRRAYLIPLLVPPYMHALAWMSVAGRRQALDQMAAALLGPDRLSFSAYGFLPAVLVLGLALMPLVTLIALAGLEAIDSDLLDEARVLRPGAVVAGRVLVPLALPSILAGSGLVFVLALVEYGVPSALQYNVYSMEIYAQFSQDAEPTRALSSAISLLIPAALVLAASQAPAGKAALRGGRRRPDLDVPGWPLPSRLVLAAAVAASGLASIGTVAALLVRTGQPGSLIGALGVASGEIGLSLQIAVASATLAALVALPIASALTLRRGPSLLWLLVALPLAIPSPLAGVALVFATNGPWLDWSQDTPLVLALAHATRLLPFAVFAAAAQVRRVDQALVEAASLHDVGAWRRLEKVGLPLLAPAAAVAWLVVFVFSLGELGVSLLVVPPGQATLPIRIYNLMHYGATDTVAALSLIALGAAAAGAGLFAALRRLLWPWTL